MEKIGTLGKLNRLKLRQHFYAELGLTERSKITSFMKAMDVESKADAYETMMTAYNAEVDVFQRKAKQEKKEKKNSMKTIIKTLTNLKMVTHYRATQLKHIENIVVISNKKPIITYKSLAEAMNAPKQINPMLSILRSRLHTYIDIPIMVTFLDDRMQLIQTNDLKPEKNYSSWWGSHSPIWFINSSSNVFQEKWEGNVYIYPQKLNITPTYLKQHFREGVTNCMISPIRAWATEKMLTSTSKQSKSRYNVILGKIEKYELAFVDGVPEDAIHEMCNSLQIDISVEMPFCETAFLECKSLKKSLKSFRFLNSRFDHAEHFECEQGHHRKFNKITSLDKAVEISQEELNKMVMKLDETKEFYLYKKKSGNITCVSTLHGQFKTADPFTEAVQKFELDTGLNFCKIDDIDDKDLSAFVKDATNYNETVDFRAYKQPKFIEGSVSDHPYHAIANLKHADMEKAYANFKKCKWYAGFLGKITDFRPTDKIQGVGIYRITNLNFKNCDPKFTRYNSKMKIYLNNNAYTSPELTMLSAYGATYEIVSGCWGIEAFDFEFNDEMLNSRIGDTGVRYYARYAGVCDSHHMEKKQWMKCSEKLFKVMEANSDADVKRYYANGEASFCYNKKHNYHLGHITAFITAYQRLSVLEQLMEIKYENIVRVCVDGIYYDGEEVEMKNVFRSKDDRNFNNLAYETYVSEACVKSLRFEDGCPREQGIKRDTFAKELHLGEGGSGKTHYNLKDLGLVRPMFIAPSWKLAVKKKLETGINATVWARALTTDPVRITAIKERANVLIIDEVSMLTENQKKQFFDLYGDMKIIMCGDLGYQLPCIDGEEMNPEGFDNVVQHPQDYRCQDIDLRHVKKVLREMIKYGRSKKEINEWVMAEFKRLGRTITTDELKQSYDVEDMVLSGTNANKDYFTGMFAGKFPKEKYYITENTRLHQNGEIVIGDKPESKCEVRHCFTVHSIQGETAECDLFIDGSTMFDARMFYTAISRARKLSQIFILCDVEKTIYELKGKIYKIVSKSGTYIGSTTETIEQRFKGHTQSFKAYEKGVGKFITSYKLMGDDDVRIELVADFPCNSKLELWKEEARIIKSVECVNKTYKTDEC